jgi:CDP-diglyceride synthetase
MIYFVIFVSLVWIWLISEWINAPRQPNTNKDDSSAQSNDTNSKGV